VKRYPSIQKIRIVDDCPIFDLLRFKNFLHLYLAKDIGKPLHIDNVRADRIDDELPQLVKKIGIDHLCLGVESGNPAVFAAIHKGETLQQIQSSANLIKKHGVRLYLGFVIGIPNATSESENDSINLALQLKPN
jgi:anaerobic magnesium-protoporphyrin IX monomethyl ester cyclase